MSIKSIAITGYKPHELNIFKEKDTKIDVIKEALKKKLLPLLEDGLEWVVISGQPGVETWAFDVIQSLKENYSVKIAVIPPFSNQEKVWKEDKQLRYQQLLNGADFSKPLSEKEYVSPKQYQTKNRWMVEKTDGCLILFEEEHGGSPKFFYQTALTYQDHHLYEIIVLDAFELDEVARDLQESGYWNN
ncbi:SLOG family protein [Alkalibacillus aidingensis]|uniref:SLOG family protein n=1 Tax=Alkalibacillus aidingensis TaxID=2747607 RepID=UPI001660FC73|nr:SLOG family protein [Alkalibacillus aidingensis]